jgi:hypothetical protein
MDGQKDGPAQVDWRADPYWRTRRLSPAQILVHDVRLEGWRKDVGPMLEMKEVLSSSFESALDLRDGLLENTKFEELSNNRTEQQQFQTLFKEYGWLNCLRSKGIQETLFDREDYNKLRWM